jgi:hypothetical protein
VTLKNVSLVEKVVGKNAEIVGTVNHPRQRTNLKIRKHLQVSRNESTELEHTCSGISDKMLTKILVPGVVNRHRFVVLMPIRIFLSILMLTWKKN